MTTPPNLNSDPATMSKEELETYMLSLIDEMNKIVDEAHQRIDNNEPTEQ